MSSPQRPRREIFTADARLSVADAAAPTAEKIATLSGYAILYNVLSTDRGGYKVRLLPDSATFTPAVHALWHHDFSRPLGDTVSGSLRLFPDADGVRVEIDLPDTTDGRNTRELVKSKRVRDMSFAMVDAPTGEKTTENGQTVLNVARYVVDEVTVTPIPAFVETTVGVVADDVSDGPPAAVIAAPGYAAARARQAVELERLRFSTLRLPGAEHPRAAG